MTEHGGHVDHAGSSSYLVKTTLAPESISMTDNDSKIEQPKREVLLTPEGHPIRAVRSAQSYGLNLMSTMLGTQMRVEGGTTKLEQTISELTLHYMDRCLSSWSLPWSLSTRLKNLEAARCGEKPRASSRRHLDDAETKAK
ncbi:hypothetical protein KIW84_060440 [Lathyrus oleraceus]|uniref:Uncharacterized protein n=1 Tax=Pisum sativum TaxID=3888 RepID=A0A9D4W2D2_PEA|nr:hypothetical protein KIW84_060440 [Pisum sativum]